MVLLGDPFIATVPRQITTQELIQAIRTDIAGELEAIIGYEAHAQATGDERAKKVLYHIADEEKRHIGELQQLLYLLNPTEQQHIEKGMQDVKAQQSQSFSGTMS